MPPTRRASLVVALALVVIPSIAAAHIGPGIGRPDFDPGVQGVAAFVPTLLLGGILLVVAPRDVDRVITRAREELGASFLWGLGILALFVGLFVLLIISIVGIILAIPLLIVFVVVAILGNAVGYLALFSGVVDSRGVALVLGAAAAGVTAAIPVVGDLVGFVVGSLGLGAMAREWRDA